jgi:hypothetical protein
MIFSGFRDAWYLESTSGADSFAPDHAVILHVFVVIDDDNQLGVWPRHVANLVRWSIKPLFACIPEWQLGVNGTAMISR